MATPNGIPSQAWFEWGVGNSCSQQTTAANIGSGNRVVWVSAAITGLSPGSDYTSRLVVSNTAGVTYGAAQSFTTGRKVAMWQNSATNWPAALTNAVAIAGDGSHFLAIRNDGTVAAWGSDTYGESDVPGGLSNVVAVSCGSRHSVALKADGTVMAWGVSSVIGETAVPTGLSNVVAIATGNGHNLALVSDGTVVAWGENEFGQANVPAGLSNIVAVACGGFYSLALRNDGTLTGWGSGDNGSMNFPASLTNVIAIAAGFQLTVALQADGTVWALGALGIGGGWYRVNFSGTLTGSGNTRAIAAGGYDAVWLASDGSVTNSAGATVAPGLSNVVAISSGWLALAPNVPPQVVLQTVSGFPNSDLSIALPASDVNGDPLTLRIIGLPAVGALYQFTNGVRGAAIANAGTIVSDSAGRVIFAPVTNGFGSPYDSFSFVANDGQVDSALATVTIDMAGIPYAFTRPAIKVHATDAFLSGTVTPNGLPTSAWWEWGPTGNYGQVTSPTNVGSGTAVTLVSAGISNLTLGTVYHCRLVVSNAAGVTFGAEKLFTTGRNVTQFQGSLVPGLSNLVAIAGGGAHSLGLRNDGTVAAWGSNSSGQTNVPVGMSNIVAIAAGGAHSLAVRDDGWTYGWGDHSQNAIPYQLGGVSDLAGGAYHTLALKYDGTVVGFGAYSQNLGQVTPPAGLSNVVAISAGAYHSLALKNDGTVVAWGSDYYGQVDVPSGLSNVVAIAAGSYHSLALQKDGNMVTWGTYNFSTIPLPSGLSNVVEIAAGNGFNLAMAADGTIAGGATVPGIPGGVTVPGNMSSAAHLAANSYDALAIANLPPSASPKTASGPANRDILVMLSGADGNLDALGLRVINLPATGQLFQCLAGSRGDAITTADTVATDPQGRIIFAPAIDSYGVTTFNYVANDGWTDSAPASVTLTVTATARAVTGPPTLLNSSNVVLNGWSTGGGLSATAWFEWGTNSAFGQRTTPANLDTGLTGTLLSTPLESLAPGGEYHFRLVVSNAATVAFGAEKIFTTGRPVLAWGANNFGQTSIPATLTNALAVAGGTEHSLALLGDGTVAGWGRNDAGQASPPLGLSNVTAVAAGAMHSLALLSDGSLTAWGTNNFGQTNVPAGLGNVMAIAAGANHNLALYTDGTVAAWGLNTSGQTNVPAGLSNVVAVSAGWSHSLALKFDGTLTGWGSQTPPANVSNVTAIASAGNHNLALLNNGTVTAWGGANSYGENNVPATLTNAVAIAAGTNHSLALRQDGTILFWGRNDLGQSSLPPAAGACLGIAAGSQHTLALANATSVLFALTEPPGRIRATNAVLRGMATANGTGAVAWFQWGTNFTFGQLTTPTPVTDGGNVTAISNAVTGLKPYTVYGCRLVVSNAAGVVTGRTAFFATGGRVRAWGMAASGQTNVPPTLTGVVAVSAGISHAVALMNDGSVAAWGANNYGQTNVPSAATNLIAVSAGGGHTLALTADGHVIAWGRNLEGQTNVPATLGNVLAVAAGDRHSLALRADGSVVAWGDNSFGQTNVPTWLSNVVAVAAGGNGSMALKHDGIAVAWGNPASLPPNLNTVTAIGAGTNNSIVLKRDGRVVVWGSNATGQTNVPAGLTNAVDVAVGDQHGAALKADGTVTAWMGYSPGINTQTNVPSDLTNVVAISVAGTYNLSLVAAAAPPRVVTLPPAPNGPGSVTFNGAAVLNDSTALAWFEWGTNGTFVQATSPGLLNFTNYTTFVGSVVNGLVPGGIYSCRLAASNSVGLSYGSEQRFTTGRKMLVWGNNSSGQTNLPAGLTNVVAVAGGQSHSAALLNDGTVRVWGGTSAQTNVPAGVTNVIAIASGLNHLLALRADHSVIGWGVNNFGQTTIPAAATNVLAIACGQYHSLALRADGKVVAWGNNGNGQANVPSTLADVVAIAGGGRHTLALKSDGTVRAWGDNAAGQTNVPAAASNVVAIAAGDSHSLCLRADGTVVAWGSLSAPSSGNTNFITIAAGCWHDLALKTNGTLVGWGDNGYGQSSPPAGVGGIAGLAAGMYHSLIIGPNLPPSAAAQSVVGAANQDLLIVPAATDPNGDAVNFRIASLPAAGALYQWASGTRGPAITTPNTPASDALGRVIFVPGTDVTGWPYASFSFVANDGEADSSPATTTVNIIFAPVISVNAGANVTFSFNFTGDTNAAYSVWTSTNLIDWNSLGAVGQSLSGVFQFTDTSAVNGSARFYRVTCP